MGHRALVAYERTDGMYNLHYSHWGGANLRLKHRITTANPYAGECPAQWGREAHQSFTAGENVGLVVDRYNIDGSCPTDVDPVPSATRITLSEALESHIDYLTHEAFYVVDRELDVTAYRTLWFGLQYDAESIEQHSTVGFGAIRTVRWYDGEPVSDGYVRGQLTGMKHVLGTMIDRGVLDEAAALALLKDALTKTTDQSYELHFGAVP